MLGCTRGKLPCRAQSWVLFQWWVKVTAVQSIWSSVLAVSQWPLRINNGSRVGRTGKKTKTGHLTAYRTSQISSQGLYPRQHPVPSTCCSSTFLFDAMQPSLPHILHFPRSQFGFQKEGESENKNREKELGDTFTPSKVEGLCYMTERKQQVSPLTSWVTHAKLFFLHCNISKMGL